MIVKINKIPNDIFLKLKEIIKDKQKEIQHTLAGNIEEEYDVSKYTHVLENYLIKKICEDKNLMYCMNSQYICNTEDKPLVLDNLWVNYMKKYEFNPVHHHSGCFSFIIFIKVPYTNEEQRKVSPGKKSRKDMAGALQFISIHPLGFIETNEIYADKDWEQSMLIFPSGLNHTVYPFFNTDEYRITMSGNVKFKV